MIVWSADRKQDQKKASPSRFMPRLQRDDASPAEQTQRLLNAPLRSLLVCLFFPSLFFPPRVLLFPFCRLLPRQRRVQFARFARTSVTWGGESRREQILLPALLVQRRTPQKKNAPLVLFCSIFLPFLSKHRTPWRPDDRDQR